MRLEDFRKKLADIIYHSIVVPLKGEEKKEERAYMPSPEEVMIKNPDCWFLDVNFPDEPDIPSNRSYVYVDGSGVIRYTIPDPLDPYARALFEHYVCRRRVINLIPSRIRPTPTYTPRGEVFFQREMLRELSREWQRISRIEGGTRGEEKK